jgi:hypothetical protein
MNATFIDFPVPYFLCGYHIFQAYMLSVAAVFQFLVVHLKSNQLDICGKQGYNMLNIYSNRDYRLQERMDNFKPLSRPSAFQALRTPI